MMSSDYIIGGGSAYAFVMNGVMIDIRNSTPVVSHVHVEVASLDEYNESKSDVIFIDDDSDLLSDRLGFTCVISRNKDEVLIKEKKKKSSKTRSKPVKLRIKMDVLVRIAERLLTEINNKKL